MSIAAGTPSVGAQSVASYRLSALPASIITRGSLRIVSATSHGRYGA